MPRLFFKLTVLIRFHDCKRPTKCIRITSEQQRNYFDFRSGIRSFYCGMGDFVMSSSLNQITKHITSDHALVVIRCPARDVPLRQPRRKVWAFRKAMGMSWDRSFQMWIGGPSWMTILKLAAPDFLNPQKTP